MMELRNNNWQVKTLKEIGSFDKGAGISKADILPHGLPCIRYAEIYTTYNYQVKECVSHIAQETAIKSKQIKYGQILFTGSGETAEEIAKTVAYLNKQIAYASGDIIIFTLKNKQDSSLFYSYYLNTVGRKQLNKLGEGQSIVHIYPKALSKVQVPYPPIEEQQKIVEVLESWDKAINLTKRLIEQKELQKMYLMQQLLTGRIRLKGFTGKWKNIKLGAICTIRTGKLDANAMKPNGKYKFFTCAQEVFSIDTFAFDTEALLVSGNGANVGYIHYYKGKFNAYQRTYVLDSFSEHIVFIKYILNSSLYYRIEKEKKAGNTPYIVLSTLADMQMYIPQAQGEQKAIADTLSSCDKEIDLLKQKLTKLEEQKKGLMQVLLTGKVRLK